MRRTYLSFVFLLLIHATSSAQIGGGQILSSLSTIQPARISGGGGAMMSHLGKDPGLALVNPSLLNPAMDKGLVFNSIFHYSGISQGAAAFVWKADSIDWTWSAGASYTHFGNFAGKDASLRALPNFVAQDVMAFFGGGKQDGDYSYGFKAKLANSQYDVYGSLAVLVDLAASWHNKEKKLSAGIMLKNVGTQISTFTPSDQEPLPFDIQIGITKELEHLPFRFSFLAHHLHVWEIRYPSVETSTQLLSSDSTTKEKKYVGDKLLRHLSFGGEILLHKNFHVLFGYDHMKRREMTISTRRGMAGFSMGFDVNVKKLRLTYGRSWYYIAGASNQISISTQLDKLTHRKKKAEDAHTTKF